ncbi:MAG: potassium channel protein [Bacteroidota bacterium]
MSLRLTSKIRILFFGGRGLGAFTSIKLAMFLALTSLVTGTLGFILVENYNLIEAIYMTVITISTVGFSEVKPLTLEGRLFASLFILLNVGVFAYVLYAFTDYVIEGKLFEKIHKKAMNDQIEELEGHVIICGYGRYGEEVADNVHVDGLSYVVIDMQEEALEKLIRKHRDGLYVKGDASQDDILEQAGILKAKTLIAALPDDTDNVFTVLTARQLNPEIDIISRAADPRSKRKLKLAGANHTIMPEQIGGFYMAALVTKPGAVEFFSFVTNEYESDIGFEEVKFEDVPIECQCRTISELRIREGTGCNVIGYKSPNSRYIINPGPDTPLIMESSFIVLGNDEQLKRLEPYWEHYAETIKQENV